MIESFEIILVVRHDVDDPNVFGKLYKWFKEKGIAFDFGLNKEALPTIEINLEAKSDANGKA